MTLIALVTGKDKVSLPRHGIVVALVLFLLWTGVTTVFAIYPGDSVTQLEKVLKIQLMTFVALAVLRERKHIQLFAWVNALSVGFYGLKGGLFTLQVRRRASASGGRLAASSRATMSSAWRC